MRELINFVSTLVFLVGVAVFFGGILFAVWATPSTPLEVMELWRKVMGTTGVTVLAAGFAWIMSAD